MPSPWIEVAAAGLAFGYSASAALIGVYALAQLHLLFAAFVLAVPMFVLISPLPWSLERLQAVILLCVAAAVGFVAPSYWVDRRASARQLKLDHGMPDALEGDRQGS